MNNTYSPEMDITHELNAEDVTFYQELIGVLQWAMEIGRVDILNTHLDFRGRLPFSSDLGNFYHTFCLVKFEISDLMLSIHCLHLGPGFVASLYCLGSPGSDDTKVLKT